jgi:hypothetical protein
MKEKPYVMPSIEATDDEIRQAIMRGAADEALPNKSSVTEKTGTDDNKEVRALKCESMSNALEVVVNALGADEYGTGDEGEDEDIFQRSALRRRKMPPLLDNDEPEEVDE